MLLVCVASLSLCVGFYDLIMSNETYGLDPYNKCPIMFETMKLLSVIYEIQFTVSRDEYFDY